MTAAANLHRLAADVRALPARGMAAAERAATALVDAEGRRLAGADGLASGGGRYPLRAARSRTRTAGTTTTCRIQGTVPGWVWVNTGTRPHRIPRRRRGPLARVTVQHPGTRGRRAWDRVAARIARDVPELFTRELGRLVS